MSTTVLFKNNLSVGVKFSCEKEDVKAVMFGDLFYEHERLLDFVRDLAFGEVEGNLEEAAEKLMNDLNIG